MMTLQQALGMIHAPKGVTSIVAGLLSGDTGSIQGQNAVGVSLKEAQSRLAAVRTAQDNCQSDWAYWGYNGDIAYWSAVVDLLKAAAIVGVDNLPYVDPPGADGVVMDVQHRVKEFGATVLRMAEKQTKPA